MKSLLIIFVLLFVMIVIAPAQKSGIVLDIEIGTENVDFNKLPNEWYFNEEVGYVFRQKVYFGFMHRINFNQNNSACKLGARIELGRPGLVLGAVTLLDLEDNEALIYDNVNFYLRLSFGKKWRRGY